MLLPDLYPIPSGDRESRAILQEGSICFASPLSQIKRSEKQSLYLERIILHN